MGLLGAYRKDNRAVVEYNLDKKEQVIPNFIEFSQSGKEPLLIPCSLEGIKKKRKLVYNIQDKHSLKLELLSNKLTLLDMVTLLSDLQISLAKLVINYELLDFIVLDLDRIFIDIEGNLYFIVLPVNKRAYETSFINLLKEITSTLQPAEVAADEFINFIKTQVETNNLENLGRFLITKRQQLEQKVQENLAAEKAEEEALKREQEEKRLKELQEKQRLIDEENERLEREKQAKEEENKKEEEIQESLGGFSFGGFAGNQASNWVLGGEDLQHELNSQVANNTMLLGYENNANNMASDATTVLNDSIAKRAKTLTLTRMKNNEKFTIHENEKVILGRAKIPNGEYRYITIENNTAIGRKHLSVVFTDSNFVVTDLNSTNGTAIEKIPLVSGSAYILNDEEILTLADEDFKININ